MIYYINELLLLFECFCICIIKFIHLDNLKLIGNNKDSLYIIILFGYLILIIFIIFKYVKKKEYV